MTKKRATLSVTLLFAIATSIVLTVVGCQGVARMDARLTPSYSVGGSPLVHGSADVRSEAPAGSLPALDEEVWVVVKPSTNSTAQASPKAAHDDIPGIGSLIGHPDDDPQKTVPMPLKHTDVKASISAYIASVQVKQQFHNPYDSKIEAAYVFPLPENAAITGFVMTVGDRRIRGIIREREEATRIYQEARSQGYVASLLTQERPNVFTQSVANIEPGRRIDVDITYFHTLTYDDGWYEYVFPMVVGPRFNPPGFASGVGAAPRGGQGASGQKAEVQYLAPNERSGHDISLALDIMAGVPIEEIACASHKIVVSHEGSEQAHIALDDLDRIPNKDFVLRYRVAGDRVKTALLTQADSSGDGGYFTFMLVPPREAKGLRRQPMEMIFVLDCSGSMSGEPLNQAKAAIDHALAQLQPNDTFQVIRFSSDSSQFAAQPAPATAENLKRGRAYVQRLNSEGGTMMIEGVKAALDFDHDPERLRFVTFLTDGYIGNEAEILAAIHEKLGPSRIFSFGVGSSPNRYLMDRMAAIGRGAVAYLGLHDDGAQVMDRFFSRVSRPVMRGVTLAWEGSETSEMTPRNVPDLFVGRPVIVTGRYSGAPPRAVRVRGETGGQVVESRVTADEKGGNTHEGIKSVWARSRISDLMDRSLWERNGDLAGEIKSIALKHGLMSAYTSFVAVDSSRATQGDHGTTVQAAVPVPEGVRYDTTVPQ